MKLTTKTRYGVRALLEIARRYGGPPVSLKEIAGRQSLSLKYLERLASNLQRAGLLTSVRGARGGYVLSRHPEQITLREVYEVLEGSGGFVDCTTEPPGCEIAGACVTRDVWARMYEASMQVLESITLADLVQRLEQGETSRPMYYI
jgi:Rrf2 family transcriptional regulator, cysteine metabolism repressor